MTRRSATLLAGACFSALVLAGLVAPEHQSPPQPDRAYAGPLQMLPFGADQRGRPLLEYALQGARIVMGPALAAGATVGGLAVIGGVLRCTASAAADTTIQVFGELVGSLPRMVVLLVVALVLPSGMRGLLPLSLTLAVLAAPGAMDEAAAVAQRLGGARFVEALRAHGFTWPRIFLYHVVALNLRPVVIRQAAETMMAVGFLELALSYLSLQENQPSLTHADNLRSWADLLQLGYPSLVLSVPTGHALLLGLGLAGSLTLIARLATAGARAR